MSTRNGTIHKAVAHLTLAADLLKRAGAMNAGKATARALRLATKGLAYVDNDERVQI